MENLTNILYILDISVGEDHLSRNVWLVLGTKGANLAIIDHIKRFYSGGITIPVAKWLNGDLFWTLDLCLNKGGWVPWTGLAMVLILFLVSLKDRHPGFFTCCCWSCSGVVPLSSPSCRSFITSFILRWFETYNLQSLGIWACGSNWGTE